MADTDTDCDPAGPVPSPSPNKIEITVAGHTIVVESDERLHHVAALALDLFQRTGESARGIPAGFAPGHSDTQLAGPQHPGEQALPWDFDERNRAGRRRR